mmetsp:Transcript_40437/g.129877  ORF Transcript_40437/g.129877 Transcript_40437/m.129877 type:complete len:206 (-) Transcript_40437:830-1447(-)
MVRRRRSGRATWSSWPAPASRTLRRPAPPLPPQRPPTRPRSSNSLSSSSSSNSDGPSRRPHRSPTVCPKATSGRGCYSCRGMRVVTLPQFSRLCRAKSSWRPWPATTPAAPTAPRCRPPSPPLPHPLPPPLPQRPPLPTSPTPKPLTSSRWTRLPKRRCRRRRALHLRRGWRQAPGMMPPTASVLSSASGRRRLGSWSRVCVWRR